MGSFRILGLTLLALAVPTFAFGGEEAPQGPQSLSVSASLGGCGLAQEAIVCQIDTSWNAVEGAEYYALSVTRPDGSVLDLGQAPGIGRSLFVPYVGSGNYSVQVAAWGTPPGDNDVELLARDRASSAGASTRTSGAASSHPSDSPGGEARPTDETTEAGVAPEAPASDQPVEEPAVCEEPDDEPEDEATDAAVDAVEAVVAAAAPEELAAEGYDPADADGDRGCPLDSSD